MSDTTSGRRKVLAGLRRRGDTLEAWAGLLLVGVGVGMFSIGAALIVVGAVVFVFAIWGARLTADRPR